LWCQMLRMGTTLYFGCNRIKRKVVVRNSPEHSNVVIVPLALNSWVSLSSIFIQVFHHLNFQFSNSKGNSSLPLPHDYHDLHRFAKKYHVQ
jgi:hypothetical protein